MGIITLTTDLGTKDFYQAALKGSLLKLLSLILFGLDLELKRRIIFILSKDMVYTNFYLISNFINSFYGQILHFHFIKFFIINYFSPNHAYIILIRFPFLLLRKLIANPPRLPSYSLPRTSIVLLRRISL